MAEDAMMYQRDPERGSAMLVTMIVISALLAGGSVLVSLQLTSSRGSDLERGGLSSLYCAEAGLAAARSVVAANYTSWGSALAASASGDTSEPTWLASAINHDLDGDGVADFAVYIKDDDDEVPPAPNNAAVDNNLHVWIVSRCLKYPDVDHQVQELVQMSGGGTCYNNQKNGCGGNTNSN